MPGGKKEKEKDKKVKKDKDKSKSFFGFIKRKEEVRLNQPKFRNFTMFFHVFSEMEKGNECRRQR